MPSFLKKLLYGKELSNPYVNPYHPGHISTGAPNPSSTTPYPTYPQPAEHFPNYTQSHPTSLTLSTRVQPHSDIPLGSRDYLGEARQLAGRDPATGRRVPPHQYSSYAAASGQTISTTGHGNPQPAQQPPVTQQPVQPYQAANAAFKPYPDARDSTQWEPSSWDTGEARTNPYVTGGDAAMGRAPPKSGERGSIGRNMIWQAESSRAGGRESPSEGRERVGKGTNLGGRVYGTDNQRVGTRYDIVVREERRKKEEDARAAQGRAATGYFTPERPVVREYYGGA